MQQPAPIEKASKAPKLPKKKQPTVNQPKLARLEILD